jgi:hypothetical protein
MTYIGIDYGKLAGSNRDKATGIHYGVISQHTVGQAWYDDAEPDYGEPHCPKCGNAVVAAGMDHLEEGEEEWSQYGHGCADYACTSCEHTLDSADVFGEEPFGWYYDADGYHLVDCLDTNIFVLKSPYYTHAMFCSPCVPGAGDLDNPIEGGVKTYCLGHDWFESGKAPYPVYSVATGELVS